MAIGINGMTTGYADYVTKNNTDTKADILKSKLDTDYSQASDEELMGVCKEFESYFLEKVFKSMMDTTKLFSDDKESGDGYASKMVDYFKDSAVTELASQATQQNGIGIAQTLFQQMKMQYSAIKPEDIEKNAVVVEEKEVE